MNRYIFCETQSGETKKLRVHSFQIRVSAYGILINKKNELLVLQSHLPLWEFPGGANEPNESLHQSLVREFNEETGLTIKPKRLILERESFYLSPRKKTYHAFQHFFIVNYISGKITETPINLHSAIWLPINQLNGNNMNKGAYQALQVLSRTYQRGEVIDHGNSSWSGWSERRG